MRGIWRLSIVSGVALVAFILALVNFKQVPARECQMDAVSDSSYSAEFVTPLSVDPTTQTLRVTRNGVPVTGAQVCMRADMGGMGRMSGMGVSDVAHETDPGVYDVPVRFEMGGHWDGTVIVARSTGKAVRIPVPIEVQ
ncbi:MAG: FixH family protein [Actinomycetota bacterium]|nr:FixH family protein [Actinomycetota bacterium]